MLLDVSSKKSVPWEHLIESTEFLEECNGD